VFRVDGRQTRSNPVPSCLLVIRPEMGQVPDGASKLAQANSRGVRYRLSQVYLSVGSIDSDAFFSLLGAII
jgi:hypothetical protein